ncbi:hypothetical protein HHI36_003611 [Cryptolaemus montrouzieri]|uniref:Uncharacterized protein n=1 Tax=Cryptolaemus montrouzieri TaxID=559131 RepID=A0ABD2PFD3_9CUCU
MEEVSNILKTCGIDESNLSKVVNDVIERKKALLSENIKIGLDRTKMQQDQLRTDELKERTDRGEENLSLKYVNGVPTVSVNVRQSKTKYLGSHKCLLSECWRCEDKTW